MVPQALFFWAENRMEAERVSTDVTFSADFCTAKVSIPALGSNAFFATPPPPPSVSRRSNTVRGVSTDFLTTGCAFWHVCGASYGHTASPIRGAWKARSLRPPRRYWQHPAPDPHRVKFHICVLIIISPAGQHIKVVYMGKTFSGRVLIFPRAFMRSTASDMPNLSALELAACPIFHLHYQARSVSNDAHALLADCLM